MYKTYDSPGFFRGCLEFVIRVALSSRSSPAGRSGGIPRREPKIPPIIHPAG